MVFQFVAFLPVSFAQMYSRIEADFTVKERSFDGKQKLYSGRVYYDLNQKKIIYDITFPKKSVLVMTPEGMVAVQDGEVRSETKVNHLVKFSIFHLSLMGSLDNFGLEDTPFELENVEKSGDKVISTWRLPEQMVEQKSKIMLSQVDKILQGMVSFDMEGNILSKHIFEEYMSIKGVRFPARVLQFDYKDGEVINTRITTYRDVIINNTGNEEYYNYNIPGL